MSEISESALAPKALSERELAVLADALIGRPSWRDLAETLERASAELASFGLQALATAFEYDLVPVEHSDWRDTNGGPYAPGWDRVAKSLASHPAEAVTEVQALWRSVARAVDDPIVAARLADLLYVAVGAVAHADGRQAAAAMVALAGEKRWDALDRAECMARALEIRTELNDRLGLTETAEIAVALVDELLGQEHAGPPFIVLHAVVRLNTKSRPVSLGELLEQVVTRFLGTRHAAAALGLAAGIASNRHEKAVFRHRQLDALVIEARAQEGLAKVALLQRAGAFARRYGLTIEAAKLLKELQDIPSSELGMESVTVDTELPTEEIRAEVDRLVGSGAVDIFDALTRTGRLVPAPGGTNDDVDAEVKDLQQQYPLASIFGQTILGPESGAPHFVADTEENKLRIARGQRRRMVAEFTGGVFVAPMLDEAAGHHGRPSREDLTNFFATELIGETRARHIARALELFWDRDYDASAHVLVPRLESILRDIARARGITIVKPVIEGGYGGVISLYTVLTKLRELDPGVAWLDYLDALLCDPLAVNLRNLIAHGIVEEVGGISAALLLHAACFLATLRPKPQDSGSTKPPNG